MFRPMMRWFDQNVERLFTEALQQVNIHFIPLHSSPV